jgi:hypothetical protein
MPMASSGGSFSFADRMQPRLTDVRSSVNRALDDLESRRAGLRWSGRLRDKRDRARATSGVRRRAMEQAIATMIAQVVERYATDGASVVRSKGTKAVEQLLRRAEQAEDYATAAVLFASGSVEEASAALLEALVARIDAEEAMANSVDDPLRQPHSLPEAEERHRHLQWAEDVAPTR